MNGEGYRDYFKVLGVDRTANADAIKIAFRKLARKFHPDLNKGDPIAEERFKEINEAYEVLSDPEKRQKYEQYGQYWNQPGVSRSGSSMGTGFEVDFGQYGNFDDFINELLGRFGGAASAKGFPANTASPRTPANLDAQINLKITFLEAFRGTLRTLSINDEHVQIKIPKGVKSGSRLRVKGKGNFQPGTGRRGDLFINLDFETHPVWKIKGNKLLADLPVSFDELVLGATITTLIPDGQAQVTIPPRTLPGQSLRLRGKGWPSGKDRGDLIFTVKLFSPAKWSEKEIKLIEELGQSRVEDPREIWINDARLEGRN